MQQCKVFHCHVQNPESPSEATERVLKARPSVDPSVSMANSSPSYAPPPLQEVLSVIEEERPLPKLSQAQHWVAQGCIQYSLSVNSRSSADSGPDTVFAPHVETSAGIMLPAPLRQIMCGHDWVASCNLSQGQLLVPLVWSAGRVYTSRVRSGPQHWGISGSRS